MGFKEKSNSAKENFGIQYSVGEPTTIKANMKDGLFQHLSSEIGQKSLKIALLKDVSLKELILYPHNEDNDKDRNWRHLFYVNLETNEISATLIKTYNLAEFDRLNRELSVASKALSREIDYTDIEIDATIESKVFSGEKRFIIKFYFCKSKASGKNCDFLNDDGSVNQDAEVQFLSKEQFKAHEKFFKKQQENLFDYRLSEEIAKRNFLESKEMAGIEFKQFRLFLMHKLGYYSEERAIELLNERSSIVEEMKALPA